MDRASVNRVISQTVCKDLREVDIVNLLVFCLPSALYTRFYKAFFELLPKQGKTVATV